MIRSILNPEPLLDSATQKRIALTQLVGIPVVLGLAEVVYVSLLTGRLPTWVGDIAVLAETWAASFFIGRIRSLRKM